MLKKRAFVSLILLISILICVPALAKTPPASDKTIQKEIKIGRKGAEEIERQIPRIIDIEMEQKLQKIAERLIPYLNRKLDYTVRIVEMKDPNAFALPGGMTYFTTSMLRFLKSEDEIAAVMAHEFVHADRMHGLIQARRSSTLSLLSLAALVAASQAKGSGAAGIAAMASGIQTAVMNSYSIDLEKEADACGIEILYKAGYNPCAVLTMMERLHMEKLRHAQYELGIMQTHPEEEEREEAARNFLRDNGIEVQRRDVVRKLVVSSKTKDGVIHLMIDDTEILSLPADENSLKLITRMAQRLDSSLELELAPYDIKLMDGRSGAKELVLLKTVIIDEHERTGEMPELAELRERINNAVVAARRENRITNYFK